MKLGIIGCGWLGKRLANHLSVDTDNTIYTTNTSQKKVQQFAAQGYHAYKVDFSYPVVDESVAAVFRSLDALVISVKVARNANAETQVQMFKNLTQFLSGYSKKVIFFSTTGIYPQVNQIINEETFATEELHPKIYQVEQIVRKILPQTNVLRLAGLMGDDRLLKHWVKDAAHLSQPYKLVNFVHYKDIVHIVEEILKSNISGKTLNVVAPIHPSKWEVFKGEHSVEYQSLEKNRIIDGTTLEKILPYHYMYPNPIDFN